MMQALLAAGSFFMARSSSSRTMRRTTSSSTAGVPTLASSSIDDLPCLAPEASQFRGRARAPLLPVLGDRPPGRRQPPVAGGLALGLRRQPVQDASRLLGEEGFERVAPLSLALAQAQVARGASEVGPGHDHAAAG